MLSYHLLGASFIFRAWLINLWAIKGLQIKNYYSLKSWTLYFPLLSCLSSLLSLHLSLRCPSVHRPPLWSHLSFDTQDATTGDQPCPWKVVELTFTPKVTKASLRYSWQIWDKKKSALFFTASWVRTTCIFNVSSIKIGWTGRPGFSIGVA